jgi:superfamily II DNA helicase RecQ
MSLHFFFIPSTRPEPAQEELNRFLAQGRVLAVQREFVADGPNSGWAMCVEVVAGPGPLPHGLRSHAAAGTRRSEAVDYKQVPAHGDFEVFAALRELRKSLAQREGVPVFAVFSNEQLASIVTRRVASKAELGEIDGIGPARVEKYGDAVLGCVRARRALQPAPELK